RASDGGPEHRHGAAEPAAGGACRGAGRMLDVRAAVLSGGGDGGARPAGALAAAGRHHPGRAGRARSRARPPTAGRHGPPHGTGRMILALAGGVGGAKLALGLADRLAPEALTVAVNTADDFEHLGLHISPDIDTVTYTLAGRNNPETGWGLAGESWAFMAALAELGGETWFRLGDRDLATHVERTRRLRAGESLSAATAHVCRRLGVAHRVVPMSDDPVRTMVSTDEGRLPFQEYFVRRRCEPAVAGFAFEGIAEARASAGLAATLS